MQISITTLQAAASLGVSVRRVRALLATGRMRGYKTPGGDWKVVWPVMVTPGTRGPKRGHYQRPKGSGMAPRRGGIETAGALAVVSRQGSGA
jgi:excisionase family DNA binding protein